jgi:hypothetical protein
MKKIILCLIFTLIYLNGKCQLNYGNLIYLYKSDVENCDIFLSEKNFEFFRREDDGSTVWSLNRNTSNDRSSKFISKFCQEKMCGIWYQLHDPKEYNSIKNEFIKNGYKLIYSPYDKEFIDKFGGLHSTYSNGKIEVTFSSGLSHDNYNVYTVGVR